MSPRLLAVLAALALPAAAPAAAADRECVASPGAVLEVCVHLDDGRALYSVSRRGAPVIAPSVLGMTFDGERPARYTAIRNVRRGAADTIWEQPWGEQRLVRDNHRALTVSITGNTPLNRQVDVAVRVFDDGFGFRYQYNLPTGRAVAVAAERTEFRLVGDHQAWWYQALGPDRDEYLYTQTDARRITLAETPLTMRRADGLHLSIHEAALVDFPSMLLQGDSAGTLTAHPMKLPDGKVAWKTGPFTTPWRTVVIGDDAATLADSRLMLNLNEPNKLGDVSWFKPGKYVGIWWEMHLEKSTWGSGPKHGANNANVRRYIDFAAKHDFDGVLVEGWNRGWDGDWIANGDKFDFTTSYPDFDLPALAAYARGKGVRIIGHHETGGAVPNYERQLEQAMQLYARNGVTVVKTGHVRPSGEILDERGGRHWFADQYMVRHHARIGEAAARNRIAVNAHEPIKDTGLRRTFPNLVSREGARGQEFNAWGNPTNPPEHLTILPFTRMLAGPMDFTPGIFDITAGKTELTRRVQSTLATQLAEYVVLYSPIHMAADLPENYEQRPDALQFIKDVPTDWEESRTLQAEIGDYVVAARRPRGGRDWFLGAITDETARKLNQPLSFLEAGGRYEAQVYADGPGADYRTNPTALRVNRRIVTSRDSLTLEMAPGGGAAVRFRRLD